MQISFILNNSPIIIDVPPHITLLTLLRDYLKLTGTKQGCEVGECGACSVLLDGQLVNGCLILAPQIDGRSVFTIEGIKVDKEFPNDLQRNFIRFGAIQCGYCIPGMIMAGEAILTKNKNPSRKEIRIGITGNLCRCTGYQQIVDAIEATALERAQSELIVK
jgi:carbon-monoxide dehydrogenase small subunit